jgi:ADP-ribose pyrophosphatase YjhB (NUDIX family)
MNQDFELSLVQIKILANFLKKELLTYSEGKPNSISNDLYKYHLGYLIQKGIIDKKDKKYELSERGKGIVQNFDILGIPQKLFKVSVLVYLTRVREGKTEILMQKRMRQPYYGDIDTVSGKIVLGESAEDAAQRKLKHETGLSASVRFVGIIRKIRKNRSGNIFEDTIYHVCSAEKPEGELIVNNEYGENFWIGIEKAKKMVEQNKTFGKYTKKLIDMVVKPLPQLFYFTEITTLDQI